VLAGLKIRALHSTVLAIVPKILRQVPIHDLAVLLGVIALIGKDME
jgi:hypothetical protein